MLSHYYGFTPDQIGKLTLSQYDAYLEGISKVEKLFGGSGSSSSPARQSISKKTDKELAAIAKSVGIIPPKV